MCAHLRGEKLSQKMYRWRKNENMRYAVGTLAMFLKTHGHAITISRLPDWQCLGGKFCRIDFGEFAPEKRTELSFKNQWLCQRWILQRGRNRFAFREFATEKRTELDLGNQRQIPLCWENKPFSGGFPPVKSFHEDYRYRSSARIALFSYIASVPPFQFSHKLRMTTSFCKIRRMLGKILKRE